MARQVCDSNAVNQIHGFVSNPDTFNLTTGMEMIGFSKNNNNNLHQQERGESNALVWKSLLGKPGTSSSSSKTMNHSCSTNFYHHEYNKPPDFTSAISETSSENLIMDGAHDSGPWQDNRILVDDSSLRCVLPCERNERPSQGLSLSLSSSNPSSIGLQSFELRHTITSHQQQQMFYQGHNFSLYNSKYLLPAQELLNEFCSVGTKQGDHVIKQKSSNRNKQQLQQDNNDSNNHSLTSLEFVELQKRKTKLLEMLEEVDRRYRHYCNQMKAVVSSFEAVAGNGAATVYSALALKAMSRHFRCLKDGIMDQIQATRKATGEKNPVAPGTSRGQTPRLRIIDQALRQQRPFQQMSIMESHPWRPQRGLPERSVSVLRAWLFEHFLHPYPSDVDKHILARQTGLSRSQVSNWFINARVRLWKPMVEEMYLEEVKEHENNMAASSEAGTDPEGKDNLSANNVQNQPADSSDQKPTLDRLVRVDSECVASVISNDHKNDPNRFVGRVTDTFGSMELDFSSYNHSSAMVSYATNSNANQSFNGGVSLTLGLQQHGESGVSLAFPPATQSSLFFPRDQLQDCQPSVQYSLLDADAQNMPYRNLMDAQLLHDLA